MKAAILATNVDRRESLTETKLMHLIASPLLLEQVVGARKWVAEESDIP